MALKRIIKVGTLVAIIVCIAIFLRWCSTLPVGGYCVVDTNKYIVTEVNGMTIIEKGYKACYNADGSVREEVAE